MKEVIGDLWEFAGNAVVITTNGFTKNNGECVMGMGCAKQAKSKVKGIEFTLGAKIQENGNITQIIADNGRGGYMVAFPVKPINRPNNGINKIVKHMQGKITSSHIPGWACVAELDLIIQSAKELVALADKMNWNRIGLPRPGCGAGELNWEIVKSALEPILDERFYCHHK